MPRYWLHFANHFVDFRAAELAGLSKLFDVPITLCSFSSGGDDNLSAQTHCVAEIPSDIGVQKILSRSILLKYGCEIWATANTYSELYRQLKENLQMYQKYLKLDTSFRILVESFGKLISQPYKVAKIEETLSHLPFRGRVDLQNADHTFQIFEYYAAAKNVCKRDDEPIAICFGRMIGKGQARLPYDYNIKERTCIGNTTMDSTLSFLMTNIAGIRQGAFVCDPFVGTGSLLLPAAHFGAYCVGTEIKYNVLHGLGKSSRAFAGYRKPGENLIANFEQYGLSDRLVGACLADASRHDLWRRKSLFDAIITDPPYGIREKSTKIGLKPGKEQSMSSKNHSQHHPMQTKYAAGDVFLDLLNFAADYLVVGGRLVYWLPVFYKSYSDDVVPRHPRLQLVSNCEQKLTSKYGRRLVVMEKVRESLGGIGSSEYLDKHIIDDKAYFIRNCYSAITLRELIRASSGDDQCDADDSNKD